MMPSNDERFEDLMSHDEQIVYLTELDARELYRIFNERGLDFILEQLIEFENDKEADEPFSEHLHRERRAGLIDLLNKLFRR